MLSKLPEELVMLVMAKLDPLSLANLERTSTALQSIIQEGNLWKRMADDANKADPYPFITGMLRYASMRQITDCRAFKIILGARREIEQIVEGYQREMKELRMQEVHDIRIVLIEKSVGQVKALSRKHLMMEEKDYPVMSEHRFSRFFLIVFCKSLFRALFHRILSPSNLDVSRGLQQVKAVLEKLNFVHQPPHHSHQPTSHQLTLQPPSSEQPFAIQHPTSQCKSGTSPKKESA